MVLKRMRIFAGPNGSGKTTIFKGLLAEEKIQLGVYVNADDIENEITHSNSLNFEKFQIEINELVLINFFKNSHFSPVKRVEPDLWKKLSLKENTLHFNTKIDSYLAADLADFIREQLIIQGMSFTYETVMSHPNKISFFNKARQNGYRVYLYYIATEDPSINISRVKLRVTQNGHDVAPDVIRSRYARSLSNLKAAVKATDRAYIFDNSTINAILIAEVTDGIDVVLNEATPLPNWVAQHLLN